jgi:hypothetical protein
MLKMVKIVNFCWAPVAHTCKSYSEAQIKRIVVQSQSRQIVPKTLSQKKKKKKSQRRAG